MRFRLQLVALLMMASVRTAWLGLLNTELTRNESRHEIQDVMTTCTDDVIGCDFDTSWCRFHQRVGDDPNDLQWVRGQLPPILSGSSSLPETGALDHNAKGPYVYLDTFNREVPIGSQASFEVPIHNDDFTAICVEFDYFTMGIKPPTLAVKSGHVMAMSGKVRMERLIEDVKVDSQGRWEKVRLGHCVQQPNATVVFESEKRSEASWVAIDNIRIRQSNRGCRPSKNALQPLAPRRIRATTGPRVELLTCGYDKDTCDRFSAYSSKYDHWRQLSKLSSHGKTYLPYDRYYLGTGSPTTAQEGLMVADLGVTPGTEIRVDFWYRVVGTAEDFFVATVDGSKVSAVKDLSISGSNTWQAGALVLTVRPNVKIGFYANVARNNYAHLDDIEVTRGASRRTTAFTQTTTTTSTTTTTTTPKTTISTTPPQTTPKIVPSSPPPHTDETTITKNDNSTRRDKGQSTLSKGEKAAVAIPSILVGVSLVALAVGMGWKRWKKTHTEVEAFDRPADGRDEPQKTSEPPVSTRDRF